jgi:hypothetical protein
VPNSFSANANKLFYLPSGFGFTNNPGASFTVDQTGVKLQTFPFQLPGSGTLIYQLATSNFAVTAGKYYFEFQFQSVIASAYSQLWTLGFNDASNNYSNWPALATNGFLTSGGCKSDGKILNIVGAGSTWSPSTPAQYDWVGVAIDLDNGFVYFRNITQSTPSNPLWNNNVSANPAGVVGGISITNPTPDNTNLTFMMQSSYGTDGNTPSVGANFNFGVLPYIGAPPAGFSNMPPNPATGNVIGVNTFLPAKQMPASDHPLVDDEGITHIEWVKFFAAKTLQPPPAQVLFISGNPFSFQAPNGGTAFVAGGVVTDISISRGTIATKNYLKFSTGLAGGPVPLGRGDTIYITYSGAPTVFFLPNQI